jgi:hypothetical protein
MIHALDRRRPEEPPPPEEGASEIASADQTTLLPKVAVGVTTVPDEAVVLFAYSPP